VEEEVALPRHHIDRFMIFCDTVIVNGWCEKLCSGRTTIEIERSGSRVGTFTEEAHRPDLQGIFGGDAGSWGFVARGLLPSQDSEHNVEEALILRITAPGAEEIIIERPSERFPRAGDAEFHEIFTEFVRTVVSDGGRVLEIGARARSGVTVRERFPPPAAYVGLDIAPGPNVDVVGDAHHLSRFVIGKFNAAFSLSTFEHLLMPWKVVLELNKVLHDRALVFTHSHQTWPLHDVPWDFWRFSQDSWHGLYNRHTGFEIVKVMQAEPAYLSPAFMPPRWHGLDREVCYLASSCTARKVGEPEVAWEAEMQGIYDPAYSHGPIG
jgi:hypothetical protein